MKNILWFNEIHIADIPMVGGKGASLGEMANNGFPVPPGFAVTAQAYFHFIQKTKIQDQIVAKIDAIDVENTDELEKASAEVRELIMNTKMPLEIKTEIIAHYKKLGESQFAWITSKREEYVAVRSSATAEDLPEASFAGQQETYLNVRGYDPVVHAVKKCWASLFTARAVYYRKKNGFGTKDVGLSAIVQKMIQSDVSGILFTADPSGGDTTKIIIEAGLGLGETVVSGSITPDNYVVDKETMGIIGKKINYQEWKLIKKGGENRRIELSKSEGQLQKLPEEKIIELARIGKHVEDHYKKPMDIEWAMEKNVLYIVQARPITALDKKIAKTKVETGEKPIVEGLGASPGIVTGKVRVAVDISESSKIVQGDILVTKMTSPSWVPIMKRTSGIITDEGGSTCHAAIVSRELGIPCIVGTGNSTQILVDGEEVTLDGFRGKVYRGKLEIKADKKEITVLEEKEVDELEEGVVKESKKEINIGNLSDRASEIREKYKEKFETMAPEKKAAEEKELLGLLKELSIKVKVNVALPDAAEQAAKTNADGVGLLRAEHMITSSGMHPAEFIRQGKYNELKETVKKGIKIVAEKFSGPVWFRTFDARTDEFKELAGGEKEQKEDNPMIGWHGIRRDLDEPGMFKAQIEAIKELHDEGLKNVGVMLPFVQSVEEVTGAKQIAKEIGLQKEVDFGIMVETPAAVWIIDEMIPHINFISFGTNDLTQLTLGLDRNNQKIQKQFNEMHPAVLRELEYVINKCKKAGVKTSICGQAASNPEMVKRLVWMGIDSVSANIDAVEEIRKIVMIEEKKKIIENYERGLQTKK
ncbi:MAG: phosphoenolpyruvate synthase [Candidatus Diapherotrites archaeon]|nr:phosphoenolpyruvate synthase [Candidatus Diapherotrites archaeon]